MFKNYTRHCVFFVHFQQKFSLLYGVATVVHSCSTVLSVAAFPKFSYSIKQIFYVIVNDVFVVNQTNKETCVCVKVAHKY